MVRQAWTVKMAQPDLRALKDRRDRRDRVLP
jgi:hypothetical protein